MTALDVILARFRSQSPNVAAAFDEVQRRLAALEKPAATGVLPPVGPFTVTDGAGTRDSGVFYTGVAGGRLAKQDVRRCRSYGIGVMKWPPQASTAPFVVEDCRVSDIGQGRAMDGRGEAGYWFGQQVLATRLEAQRCAWMGMWTGAWCNRSDIGHFSLTDMPHIGLYVEHVTSNTRFHDFKIELAPGADGAGVNVEWWYGAPVGAIPEYVARFPQWRRAGSHSLIIEDFDIWTPPGRFGIVIDAGNFDITIRNGRLRGGSGIEHPKFLMDPSRPNRIDWETIDTSGLSGPREVVHSRPIGAA